MRILLSIEYDGKSYHGWQEQKNPNTIQGKIQESIYKFSQEKVKLFVAGRTDAGVHATGQIAHFETNVDRTEERWLFGLNSLLPNDCAKRIKNPNPTTATEVIRYFIIYSYQKLLCWILHPTTYSIYLPELLSAIFFCPAIPIFLTLYYLNKYNFLL